MADWARDPLIPRPYGWGVTGWGGAWGKPTWSEEFLRSFFSTWTGIILSEGDTSWSDEEL